MLIMFNDRDFDSGLNGDHLSAITVIDGCRRRNDRATDEM